MTRLETGEHLRRFFCDELPQDAQFLGNARGAVAIYGYTGEDCELAMAGRSFLSRQLIQCVFLQVFAVMRCARCTARVAVSNHRALSIDLRLGFVIEGVMRRAVKGEDVIILGMLRDECRWIHEKATSAESAEHQPGPADRTAGAVESRGYFHSVR